MTTTLFLHSHFYLVLLVSALLGLVVGSFLNVVITRYPALLENRWRRECQQYLALTCEPKTTVNLLTPRSHCPHCKQTLKSWHNIPVMSYFLLRGRCAYCQKAISQRYPLVELLSCLLTVMMVWRYGLSWQAAAILLLSWGLIALFFIDMDKQLLPDNMTLPLLWLGLLVNVFDLFTTPTQAIIAAALGYGILWSIAKAFKWIRKKDGMGYGDFKMLAMLGAWFGTAMMFNIILLAVVIGLIISVVLFLQKTLNHDKSIPFGPSIALAAWISMFFGPIIINLFFPYLG